MHVLVIGAGVIGLTSSIVLLERIPNINVTIWTEKRSPDTTSDGAAALWEPYKIEPMNLADELALISLEKFKQIINTEDASITGVHCACGHRFEHLPNNGCTSPDLYRPSWITPENESQFQYSVSTSDDDNVFHSHFLKENFTHCFHYIVPAIDMSLYMRYLEHLFYEKGGVDITQKHIHSIDEIYQFEQEQGTKGFDLVVNCSSLGSYHLFNDRNMCAYQGQTVHIQLPIHNRHADSDPLKKMFYLALSDSATKEDTYVIPRTNGVYVLGGAAQFIPNEILDMLKPEIDLNVANDILQRCSRIVPCSHLLSADRIVKHWVGWRPYRKNGMRIELAQEGTHNGGRTVLHCYGFGGCGVTLSWGAAYEVCKLAKKVLSI